MKDLFKFLAGAIYPALIMGFLFVFASSFPKYDYNGITTVCFFGVLIFSVIFVVGAVGYVITLCRDIGKNKKP